MSFDFRVDGASHPEQWGELQRALQRWVRAHGGSTVLADVAAWASLADAQAHAALDLRRGIDAMPALDDAQIDALRGEAMVGDGQAPCAFVIDTAQRFFLWRNHARERAIAQAVLQRVGVAAALPGGDDIDAVFHHDRAPQVASQRRAVVALPSQRLGILTGGPGTGKTTTVLRVLVMAQRQRQRAGLPLARIALAAPTGKAAQRLVQSVREGKRRLLADAVHPLPAEWQPLLDAIPDVQAMTVHRLLGHRPWDGGFARDAASPLTADIVVIDEASMLDLAQLHALLQALRPDAQLLLLGDADQLTSVGTGTVLMDLVDVFDGSTTVQRLTHAYRSADAQTLADALNAARIGDAAALQALPADTPQLRRHGVRDGVQLAQRLAGWSAELAALPLQGASGVAADAMQALRALDALASRQLLTALRDGPFGSDACNARIEAHLRAAWQVPRDAEWYPGRAVMVVRNDPHSGLSNGDVGLCLDDGEGQVRVWFEAASVDGTRHARSLPPTALPEHVGAFAITIHKSQGSEYEHVAVLLPPDASHRILSRQLLYTGLSRARRSAEIWALPTAIDAALAHRVQRVGGLADRLRQGVG